MNKRWFTETLYTDVKAGYLRNKPIYKKNSPLQKLEIFDNRGLGRILALDNIVQTTEKDEFIYHEMLSHVPLLSHKSPKKVLIIGGGDGGILREVLKHKIEKAALVEIDKNVIELSAKYLPKISKNSFRNKKAEVIIKDGAEFVKTTRDKYDIIIIDSSDPIGPARILFQKEFYKNISRIMNKDGIMARQCGSSFFQSKELRDNFKTAKKIFAYTSVYLAAVPTYVGGFFSLLFCSKTIDPSKINKKNLSKRISRLNLKTKYYNPEIHTASFSLPNYIKEIIK